ncbi:MAG TPA: DUF4189 domain-containing protein [Pseudolabrys sp.]|nr:DUF4189 domain-containing protein [Pseudolabrys sp.]
MRALVAATLLLATATLMLVAVNTARAAGALAVGKCGAYGQAYDFSNPKAASRSALGKCEGKSCRIVITTRHACAALAVDGTHPCGGHGWGKGSRLGVAENAALRSCYKDGGHNCMIRTFFCDAKG